MSKLTQERLKKLLDYNPETGDFTYRRRGQGRGKGQKAGHLTKNGYMRHFIDKKHYLAHRLAFLYMTGVFPERQVDHINGIKNDNRWANLRPATNSQNKMNMDVRSDSRTGVKGVWFNKRKGLYRAHIAIEGSRKMLGYFPSIDQAILARKEAEEKYHGDFRRAS